MSAPRNGLEPNRPAELVQGAARALYGTIAVAFRELRINVVLRSAQRHGRLCRRPRRAIVLRELVIKIKPSG